MAPILTEAPNHGRAYSVRDASRLKLFHNVPSVNVDGSGTDVELTRNGLGRLAHHYELEDFGLTRGQSLEECHRVEVVTRFVLTEFLMLNGVGYGPEQMVWIKGFLDIIIGARLKEPNRLLDRSVEGHDDDRKVGSLFSNGMERVHRIGGLAIAVQKYATVLDG